MPSFEQRSPRRRDADAEYSYRRPLGLREVLPAIGIAIGAGLFAFYVTKLLLQRTPLKVVRGAGEDRPRMKAKGRVHSPERSPRP